MIQDSKIHVNTAFSQMSIWHIYSVSPSEWPCAIWALV